MGEEYMRELYRNKRYVITGASAGIGKGFAEELHKRGARVVLVARRRERLLELADSFNQKREDSAEILPIDLGDFDSSEEGCLALEGFLHHQEVFGLINNAGFGSFGCFEELDIERECEMFRVNVLAPLRLTHAVLPQMLARSSGVIVNLASIAAFQPIPYMATYAATKTANLSYSLAHYCEYKSRGVNVLGVCPGPIATEFAQVADIPGKFDGTPGDSVEAVVLGSLRALERGQPLCLPGLVGKIFGYASRFTPYWFNLRVATLAMESKLNRLSGK